MLPQDKIHKEEGYAVSMGEVCTGHKWVIYYYVGLDVM